MKRNNSQNSSQQDKPLTVAELTARLMAEEQTLATPDPKGVQRQHAKGRMIARERIAALIDQGSEFFELGIWSGWGMYAEFGGAVAAGLIVGLSKINNRTCMIIANDALVKAGAFFPATVKKFLRAQLIAMDTHLPLIYLVDSAGVFLPLQDEIFPDQDDFGRIFRNNAVISAMGIPQFSAIMGNCVAGGGYLPVLCDKLLMTEGSGLYLAGPALVKAAIGQTVAHEELGGPAMHHEISGTIDFHEPDDPTCIRHLRELIGMLPADRVVPPYERQESKAPARPAKELLDLLTPDLRKQYDVRDAIHAFVDRDSLLEYKAKYGMTIVCAYARIGGFPVGIVANQGRRCKPARGPLQYGGVIYVDSSDKATRFIMDCNQSRLPIIFLHDVNGFMVGRDSEQEGIIRAGAKLVNVVANSIVPKISIVIGGSYGAGNYAMCGKGFDPRFIFAWPSCKYAVMGPEQAAGTLVDIQVKAVKRLNQEVDEKKLAELFGEVAAAYETATDVRYAAARGWVDKILDPVRTREALIVALEAVTRVPPKGEFQTGVLQV